MNEDAKMIGDALDASMREYDRGRGISQAELSRQSGVPQPTISRTLKGKSIPEMETLTRLVSVLGADRLGSAVASLLPGGASHQQASSRIVRMPKKIDPHIAEVVRLMESTDDIGRAIIRGTVTEALRHYKPAKANRFN